VSQGFLRNSFLLNLTLGAVFFGCPREEGGAPSASADPRKSSPPMLAIASARPADAGHAPEVALNVAVNAAVDAGSEEPAMTDPMASHHMDAAELFHLGGEPARVEKLFAVAPGRFNQGNKALAHHSISKRACLDGLRGVTLQTPEQRERCGGAENMVPIWRGGSDPKLAKACIDIFEYPNAACELPMVWGSPTQAGSVCKAQGKRLCTQDEWQLGCGGDPAGGKASVYAYGDTLDMNICHTNKPHPVGGDGKNFRCNPSTAQTAWNTCSTDTEPSGAFPRCRSRFGVFDQHGNVAEEMTRKTADGEIVSQLKGSAFFYVDVARDHDKPPPKDAPRDTYPDHCNYDARWHIEPIDRAFHVNYHLGFRCCKDAAP
jgi:sulfatase modifying factor 1